MRQPFIFAFIQQGLLIHECKWSFKIWYALEGSLPWIFYQVRVSRSCLKLNVKPRVRGFFITINIDTLIHYFILSKTQPRQLHRCCKWLREPLYLQVSNVGSRQWVWSFIFIGQSWGNLLIMRSICDGDNEDGITSTLHLDTGNITFPN